MHLLFLSLKESLHKISMTIFLFKTTTLYTLENHIQEKKKEEEFKGLNGTQYKTKIEMFSKGNSRYVT